MSLALICVACPKEKLGLLLKMMDGLTFVEKAYLEKDKNKHFRQVEFYKGRNTLDLYPQSKHVLLVYMKQQYICKQGLFFS